MAAVADGVIVGSALVKQVELNAADPHPEIAVKQFARDLIVAVKSVG